MIDANVRAALTARATIADLTALEVGENVFAVRDLDVALLPQEERIDRRAGVAAAICAMAVAHVERLSVHLHRYCAAVAASDMCLGHSVGSSRFRGSG